MATAVNPINIISGEPSVTNNGTELLLSVPISNIGSALAPSIFVTSVTVGGAKRTSPQDFPIFVGSLAGGSTGNLNARFLVQGMNVGQKYLLTVRGTYGKNPVLGFALNRYITIRAVTAFPIRLLKSHVGVAVQPATWSFTIYNDEPTGSSLYIAAFSVDIVAPVAVTKSPPGWQMDTDYSTYVGWISTDQNLPFSGHVAPGMSLGGFEIQSATPRSESTSYVLTSWDHTTLQAGPVGIDTVLTPGRPA